MRQEEFYDQRYDQRRSPLKLITAFCIPLIFGTLFQQFYSMVDSIVVGKFVGVDALAGVGSTGAINFLILGFANGLCSGFSILYGQRFGAKDYTGMARFYCQWDLSVYWDRSDPPVHWGQQNTGIRSCGFCHH